MTQPSRGTPEGLTATLVELVDTPSVTGEEGRLATKLAAELMTGLGRDGVERLGNNLIAGRRTGRPPVLLVGHLDTVPDQGQPPAHIENGRLFGLGCSDMKAGLAVIQHLLLDPEVQTGPFDVIGVFYDREEGPAHENGLEPLLSEVEWLSDAEFAVVLEPTDLEVQVGCNGVLNATARFRGRSAHSARPWLGENAVTKAGAWLGALHDRPPRSVVIDGLEFLEVFTVTMAHGGLARNVIPASFDVNVNYRFPPDMDLVAAERRLREVLEPADEIEIVDRAPSAPVPGGNPHLERLVAATGAARTPKQAWTDVARLEMYGVPAVNYGPGETAQAHQVGEGIDVANLPVAFEGLKRFLTGRERAT